MLSRISNVGLSISARQVATSSSFLCKPKENNGDSGSATHDQSSAPTSTPPPQQSGWFSKIMGPPKFGEGEDTTKSSHSSQLSDGSSVFELLIHKVAFTESQQYLDTFQNYTNLLSQHVPGYDVAGSFSVMVGDQNEMVHLIRHSEGWESVDNAFESTKNDADVNKLWSDLSKLCQKRQSILTHPFTFWPDPKPRDPKHIYELRSYKLRPGSMIEWGNIWARGITYRQEFSQPIAGLFTQIGQLYVVHHIWSYDSLASRKLIRQNMWAKPGWDKTVAYTMPLIKEMRSRIMLPNSFSKLQ